MIAIEILCAVFLLLGAAFTFVAALGIARFPDLFTRMHAASKAGTLGLGFMLAGAALAFPGVAVPLKALLVLLFIFLTAPVAGHMISRAAYLLKVPFWKGTVGDELRGKYSPDRKTLDS